MLGRAWGEGMQVYPGLDFALFVWVLYPAVARILHQKYTLGLEMHFQ